MLHNRPKQIGALGENPGAHREEHTRRVARRSNQKPKPILMVMTDYAPTVGCCVLMMVLLFR